MANGSYANMSDSALMDAFYGCDEMAFEELHQRWYPRLRRFFQIRGFQYVDAEELANETLIKVYGTK